jgi:hypothetical protein
MDIERESKAAREFLLAQGWHPVRIEHIERYWSIDIDRQVSLSRELEALTT